jgi:hypothetical protein
MADGHKHSSYKVHTKHVVGNGYNKTAYLAEWHGKKAVFKAKKTNCNLGGVHVVVRR